jgi:hypothetical protein
MQLSRISGKNALESPKTLLFSLKKSVPRKLFFFGTKFLRFREIYLLGTHNSNSEYIMLIRNAYVHRSLGTLGTRTPVKIREKKREHTHTYTVQKYYIKNYYVSYKERFCRFIFIIKDKT